MLQLLALILFHVWVGNGQEPLPFCQVYLRPDGSVNDQGTLAQCVFVATQEQAISLPYVPVMACQKPQGPTFHNYTGLHAAFSGADLSHAVEALANNTQLPQDFNSSMRVDGLTLEEWLSVRSQLSVFEDHPANGQPLLDCSVIVIDRDSARPVTPLIGGHALEVINGSSYALGAPVELSAEDSRLPIEVTWVATPQDEESERQVIAGPPNSNQQMLLYTFNSWSRPLDAELRPVLRYTLRATTFIANVSATFDGLPLWDSNGIPRRALSASMGDNFTMVPLPSVDREIVINVQDRREPPTLRTDANTVDRRIKFAVVMDENDRGASQTPVLQSVYDVDNYMQALGVVQGSPGGFPVGQALQWEEQDAGQDVRFTLQAADPREWRHLAIGLAGNAVLPSYYWEWANEEEEKEYVQQAFQINWETSRRAIGNTGRTTTLFDVSVAVRSEGSGGYPLLPPVPGSELPGARRREWIMVEMVAQDSGFNMTYEGGNQTKVLMNITAEPFTGNGVLARPNRVSFEMSPADAPLSKSVGLLMGTARNWRASVEYPGPEEQGYSSLPWLSPSQNSSVGPTLLGVQANPQNQVAGLYTAKLYIEAVLEPGEQIPEEDVVQEIDVALEVIAPSVVINPTRIVADAQPGKNLAVEFTIQNAGTDTLRAVLQVVEPIEELEEDDVLSAETGGEEPPVASVAAGPGTQQQLVNLGGGRRLGTASEWDGLGMLGSGRRGRGLRTRINGTTLPIPAGYKPAPSWASIAVDDEVETEEMLIELTEGRGTQIKLNNFPSTDADPEELQAVLLIRSNDPAVPLMEVPWRLRVSWAQVCPTLTRFDRSPRPGQSATAFFDVSNQSPFEMQFAFEFAAGALEQDRTDASILTMANAIEARVLDTTLPSDATVRRVQVLLQYSPDVFVRPGVEYRIPMNVHSWKRHPLEQTQLDRDGPSGLVVRPWLGLNDFSTTVDGGFIADTASRVEAQSITQYLDSLPAENRQNQRVEVLFTLQVGELSTTFSTFSPIPPAVGWPPRMGVDEYFEQTNGFLSDEIQRQSLITPEEGLAGEWAQYITGEPLQFPERVITSDATYEFLIVLSDSRQQRTWLRPSRGEQLDVSVVSDEPGQSGSPAEATVVQDLSARGVYRVTLRYTRTGASILNVRLRTDTSSSSQMLRSYRIPGPGGRSPAPGVRLVVPGATCDASAGLAREEQTQLVCVCGAGYQRQGDVCEPCPVGTTKARGGNQTQCSRCQSGQFSLGRQYPCMACPQGIIADGATTGGLLCVNGQPDILNSGFWFESPAAHLDHLLKVTVPRYRQFGADAVDREASVDQRALPRHIKLLQDENSMDGSEDQAEQNQTELEMRMSRAGSMQVDPDDGTVRVWGPDGFEVPFPPLYQNRLNGKIEFNRSITYVVDENGTLVQGVSRTGPTGAYELLEQNGVLGPLLADAFRGAVPRLWWLYLTSARDIMLDREGVAFDDPTAGGVFQSGEASSDIKLDLPIILPCVVDGTCLFDLPEVPLPDRNFTEECLNATFGNGTDPFPTDDAAAPLSLAECLEEAELMDLQLLANTSQQEAFFQPDFFEGVYTSEPFLKVANCSLGHTGSVCAECAEGFASSSGLVGECQPCWSRGASWVLTVVVLGLVIGLVGYLSLKRARAAKLVDDFEGQMNRSARRRLDGQLSAMQGDAAAAASAVATEGGHRSGGRLARRLSAKERGAPPPPARKRRPPTPPPRRKGPPASFWRISAPATSVQAGENQTDFGDDSPTATGLLLAEGGGVAGGSQSSPAGGAHGGPGASAGAPTSSRRRLQSASTRTSQELEGSSQSVEVDPHGGGRSAPPNRRLDRLQVVTAPSDTSVVTSFDSPRGAGHRPPLSPASTTSADDSANMQSKTSTTISIARVIINYLQALSLLQAPSSPMLNNSLKSASVSDGVALGLHPIQCAFQFSLFDRLYVTLALPIAAVAVPVLIALVLALLQWCEVCTGSESAVEARIHERLVAQGGVGFASAAHGGHSGAGGGSARSGLAAATPSPRGGGARQRRHHAVLLQQGGSGSPSQESATQGQSKGRWFRLVMQDNMNRAVTASVVVLFLLHQSVSKMIMNLFATYDFRIYGRTLLQADMSVSTSDNGYTVAYAMGWVGVVLYVFGIPIAGAAILSSLSRSGDLGKQNTIARWGFLYAGLSLKRPMRFLWELVVIARKLALIGIATLITQSVMLQGLAALLVLLVAIVLQLLAKPFDSRTLNYLEMSALGVLIITQIGILFIELQQSVAAAAFLIVFNVTFLIVAVAVIFMSADDEITDVITKANKCCKPVEDATCSCFRTALLYAGFDDPVRPTKSKRALVGRHRLTRDDSSGPGFVAGIEMSSRGGAGGTEQQKQQQGRQGSPVGSPSGGVTASSRPTFDFSHIQSSSGVPGLSRNSKRGSFHLTNPMQRALAAGKKQKDESEDQGGVSAGLPALAPADATASEVSRPSPLKRAARGHGQAAAMVARGSARGRASLHEAATAPPMGSGAGRSGTAASRRALAASGGADDRKNVGEASELRPKRQMQGTRRVRQGNRRFVG